MSPTLDYEEWKLVYTCAHEQEADMIESFLAAEEIETLRKYPDFSDMARIIGGMTRLGVDIYVKESQLTAAALILSDILSNPEK